MTAGQVYGFLKADLTQMADAVQRALTQLDQQRANDQQVQAHNTAITAGACDLLQSRWDGLMLALRAKVPDLAVEVERLAQQVIEVRATERAEREKARQAKRADVIDQIVGLLGTDQQKELLTKLSDAQLDQVLTEVQAAQAAKAEAAAAEGADVPAESPIESAEGRFPDGATVFGT
mgnify:CR=1 FL=1